MDKRRVPGVGKRPVSKAVELDLQHLGCCCQTYSLLCSEGTLKDFGQINGPSEGTEQPNKTTRSSQHRDVFSPGTAGFPVRVETLRQSAKYFSERSRPADVFVSNTS